MQKKNEMELPKNSTVLNGKEMLKCEGGAKKPLTVLREQLYHLMKR